MLPLKVVYTDICSSQKHLETTSRIVSFQAMVSNKAESKEIVNNNKEDHSFSWTVFQSNLLLGKRTLYPTFLI